MDLDSLAHVDGVVLLTHFCERHGPRVLLSTAKMPNERATEVLAEEEEEEQQEDEKQEEKEQELEEGAGATLKVPEQRPRSHSKRLSSQLFEAADASSSCNGCSSIATGEGYVAFSGTSFCATSKFPEAALYTCCRKVCVRSLSCELVPGREGPVLFGEQDKGLVLSYPFTIRDSQSRGFSRTMSLIFLHRHPETVLSSTRHITATFAAIQKDLKERAALLFEKEQRVDGGGPNTLTLRRIHKTAAVRTLTELVGLPDLFLRLHWSFSELLLSAENALPSIDIDTDNTLTLHAVFAALGEHRFGVLLNELLLGRQVEVSYDASQHILARKLWESLKLLSPHWKEMLRLEQRAEGLPSVVKGASLVLQVLEPAAKLHLIMGNLRQPLASKVVRDVFLLLEQQHKSLFLERALLEAIVQEFSAVAACVKKDCETLSRRRAYAKYELDPNLDHVFVHAWSDADLPDETEQ